MIRGSVGFDKVATGSYSQVLMPRTLEVGIKQLKNSLSAYLREVRAGHRVLVTDRGEVVAELRRSDGDTDRPDEVIREWLEAGEIVPPERPKLVLRRPGVSSSPEGTSGRILDELRGAD